jgi:cell division protein FtsB
VVATGLKELACLTPDEQSFAQHRASGRQPATTRLEVAGSAPERALLLPSCAKLGAMAEQEQPDARADVWRYVRWTLVVLAIGLGVAALLGDWYSVCEDQLVGEPGPEMTVVSVCRDPGVTDLLPLTFLLVVLLLLWPELSELGIPGFLTLKRRVQAAEVDAEDQRERQTQLERQVQELKVSFDTAVDASTRSSAQVNINLGELGTSANQVATNLEAFGALTQQVEGELDAASEQIDAEVPSSADETEQSRESLGPLPLIEQLADSEVALVEITQTVTQSAELTREISELTEGATAELNVVARRQGGSSQALAVIHRFAAKLSPKVATMAELTHQLNEQVDRAEPGVNILLDRIESGQVPPVESIGLLEPLANFTVLMPDTISSVQTYEQSIQSVEGVGAKALDKQFRALRRSLRTYIEAMERMLAWGHRADNLLGTFQETPSDDADGATGDNAPPPAEDGR